MKPEVGYTDAISAHYTDTAHNQQDIPIKILAYHNVYFVGSTYQVKGERPPGSI